MFASHRSRTRTPMRVHIVGLVGNSPPPAGFLGLPWDSRGTCAKVGETLLGVLCGEFQFAYNVFLDGRQNFIRFQMRLGGRPKSLSMVNQELAPASFRSSSLRLTLLAVFDDVKR